VPLRIALAQVDLTVGDVAGNADVVRRWTALAAEAGAQVLAFPEMTLTGYPIEDLVFRTSFLDANRRALDALAAESGELAVVVGYLDRDARGPRNAAAVLQHGGVATRYYKHFLPNYGVFDEQRYFAPGSTAALLDVGGTTVGLTICEDLWVDGGPVAAVGRGGAQVVLVINGSPYERTKSDYRRDLVARRAAEAGATFAYVNTTGAQDELVFDGDSMVVAPDGTVLARAGRFAEELLVVDVEPPPARPVSNEVEGDGLTLERITLGPLPPPPADAVAPMVAAPLDDEAEVYGAVLAGTRDYVRKNGFRTVILCLSGGIDSALVATIAVDAVGAENVHTVAMPSAYSSQGSLDDAAELARRQGTRHSVIPIEPMVAAYLATVPGGLSGIAAENLQARVRGTLVMALSNQAGHLVLTTGNKSELATGFSTLYGDSAGGWAPIKDVPKTMVWALSRWRNAQSPDCPPIPESSIEKPPSAELAPGQLDADRLPPYEVLDDILDDYVERDVGRDALVAQGFDPAVVDRVIRLVDVAEYKRRQYPPGPKLTPRAFGRDRRLPITNRWVDRPG
jgi:NAD+ synthase (glutamine-hydrolysing)